MWPCSLQLRWRKRDGDTALFQDALLGMFPPEKRWKGTPFQRSWRQWKTQGLGAFDPAHRQASGEEQSFAKMPFDDRFIIRMYKHVVNGETIEIPCDRPFPTPDIILTVFPSVPSYLSKKLPPKRKTAAHGGVPQKRRKDDSICDATEVSQICLHSAFRSCCYVHWSKMAFTALRTYRYQW